jgi:hypothetical protein
VSPPGRPEVPKRRVCERLASGDRGLPVLTIKLGDKALRRDLAIRVFDE